MQRQHFTLQIQKIVLNKKEIFGSRMINMPSASHFLAI